MPNVANSIKSGVLFSPLSGLAGKHTYVDYGLYLVEPVYTSRKRKEVLVDVPYMHGSLDFSKQFNGESYYQDAEVTYKFVRQFDAGASGATAMAQLHKSFESYCWNFEGNLYDDYGKTFVEATCTAFTAVPHPGSNTLEIEVSFRAKTTA